MSVHLTEEPTPTVTWSGWYAKLWIRTSRVLGGQMVGLGVTTRVLVLVAVKVRVGVLLTVGDGVRVGEFVGVAVGPVTNTVKSA